MAEIQMSFDDLVELWDSKLDSPNTSHRVLGRFDYLNLWHNRNFPYFVVAGSAKRVEDVFIYDNYKEARKKFMLEKRRMLKD